MTPEDRDPADRDTADRGAADRGAGSDDLPPSDPVAALNLIRQQRAEALRRIQPDPRWIYWPWGVAWLVGFGLLFLRFGPDQRVFVDLPSWLPLAVLYALLIAAGTVTSLVGSRSYGQVVGDSSRRGAWYGAAWLLGYVSLGVTLSRVTGALPVDRAGLLWSASAVGLTGVLHIAGAAIWLDRNLYLLGVWIIAVNVLGVIAGPGWQALLIALAGGGGILVAGAIARLRQRRSR
ncbi:transporter [Micromonospora sp. NPDC049559]|uniref:transporter n=1 Tax=Micromonospora sp. NPDC049559 TaxID=3155923 RepID=UPI003437CC12